MTYLELRHAIVELLNKADNLSAEEIYGVVASIEAEVRFGLLGTLRKVVEEKNND